MEITPFITDAQATQKDQKVYNSLKILIGILLRDYLTEIEINSLLKEYYNKLQIEAFLLDKQDNITANNGVEINGVNVRLEQTVLDNIEESYGKIIRSLSVTGDSNKTVTITKEDGTILTASFLDNNTVEFPDDAINTLSFNLDDDGALIAITSEGSVISVSLDGRHSLLNHKHVITDIDDLQGILDSKQDNLTSANAGDNITIAGGVISSEAGGATELVEVTQQAYQDKALYVPAFDIGSGMTYQEGSVDLGLSQVGYQMGLYSFRAGVNTEASGNASVAIGYQTVASRNDSTAMGSETEASGGATTAMGDSTEANEYASLAIGQFSTGGVPETNWTPGSPIFKVGNGTRGSNRKNS